MTQPGEKLAKLEGQIQRIWFGFICVGFPFSFFSFFLLFNPIHTMWYLRGLGVWEKCCRMMTSGLGSKTVNKKRRTRYAEESPRRAGPLLAPSCLLLSSEMGKQHLSPLISCLHFPRSPPPPCHDHYTYSVLITSAA